MKINKIIKRDSRVVEFDLIKVKNAVILACKANNINITPEQENEVLDKVASKIDMLDTDTTTVEQVQDFVVQSLFELNLNELAVKYDAYRKLRSQEREKKTQLMEIVAKIGMETDRDNANVGNNFSAKLLRIASEANKWHVLLRVLPKDIAARHEYGDYYIHDLDSYNLTINCLHVPTHKLLTEGFNTGYGTIKPAQSIEAAAAIVCIALQSSQNDMFGGQSHPNFDNDLSDVVRLTREKIRREIAQLGGNAADEELVERILDKRVHQAMQAFVFNLNTMHARAGSQVVFSSVNIGVPFTKEAAMVCKAFLEEYEKGLGNGEQPIFPNIIFRIKDGVNKKPEDPYYYLFEIAARVASKRMNPTFMNLDADFNKIYYDKGILASTMGCRTYLLSNINGEAGVEGRGNNAPCTINLVRLAIKADKDINKFFESLNQMCDLTKDQLLHRYSVLKKLKVKDLPFVAGRHLMKGSENLLPDDSIEPILKNGTWGIGFIGLAETLKLLTGYHHGESQESQELGLKIVQTIRNACDKYKEQYHLNFSCYATPAETLSGKFTVKDKKLYGNIPWVISKGFYTNSFHVPVDFPISIAKKLEIEAPYHKLCNAGHISYVEFDDYPSAQDVINIVTYAYTKTNINYIGINFCIRYCADCGERQ